MWTKPQTASFQRALATARKFEETIAMLEKLAQHNPAFAERIAALRAARDHLEATSMIALELDSEGTGDEQPKLKAV